MPNVDSTHRDYGVFLPKWKKCRDVASGEVKKHKTLYLPKLSGHDSANDPEYDAYVMRAHYYNATGRTIDALAGAVFSKAPDIDVPTKLEALIEDVTLTGCSLEELANHVVTQLLEVGRFGIMADHTGNVDQDKDITVAIAEAGNKRPKLVSYTAEQIINWRYALIDNKHQLSLVVLKEVYEEPKADIFQMEEKTRYRVLRLEGGQYIQEVYEDTGEGEKTEFTATEVSSPRIKNKPFAYIPFFMFGPCNAQEVEQPPLLDLVEANLAHYRTSADYEHGVHFTGLPTLFGKGFKLGEHESFPIGSSNAYVRSEPDADAKFIEFEGKGLEAVEKNLDRKEQHMASLGARLLQEAPRAVETAQAVNTKQSGENSVLAALAKSASKGLTWLLTIVAEWERVSEEVKCALNTDFLPDTVDSNTLNALLKAAQAGKLSDDAFAYNLQRGGYLPDEKTIEDEIADAENDYVPPPTPTLPGQAPGTEDGPIAANG